MVMKNPQRVVESNFDKLQARQGLAAKNQSQMVKLLPQLQLAGKKEKPEEHVQQKLEARSKGLKQLKANLDKVVVSVSKLYVVDREQQLKKLTSSLKKVKGIIDNKPPLGVQKHLRACVNELTSLREGVYTGAAVDKKTLSILACTKAVAHVETLITSNTKALKRLKAGAEGAAEISAADEEQMYGDIAKVLQQTQKESKNINDLKERQFVVTRVPIIPLSKLPLNPEKLKAQGFKAEGLGGYPVMHNQLVLGINKSMLEVRDISKAIKPETILEAAKKVKTLIEKQTKQKLYFVDEKPYGAIGGAWFWLMNERELSAFAKAFPGRHVQLTRFGFAF
jgi:hypothetical protein